MIPRVVDGRARGVGGDPGLLGAPGPSDGSRLSAAARSSMHALAAILAEAGPPDGASRYG